MASTVALIMDMGSAAFFEGLARSMPVWIANTAQNAPLKNLLKTERNPLSITCFPLRSGESLRCPWPWCRTTRPSSPSWPTTSTRRAASCTPMARYCGNGRSPPSAKRPPLSRNDDSPPSRRSRENSSSTCATRASTSTRSRNCITTGSARTTRRPGGTRSLIRSDWREGGIGSTMWVAMRWRSAIRMGCRRVQLAGL